MSVDVPRAQLVVTAGTPRDFPSTPGDEFCVLGRSNVGKSSFINHVFADRGLARVSSRPGKTTLANFYRLTSGETWIDLPGYGYAHASKTERERLAMLVRECCTTRPRLRGALWLLDIRHPGLSADREAWEWIRSLQLAVMVVLTKCDKVTNGQASKLAREHAACYGPGIPQIRFSNKSQQSRPLFWQAYQQWRAMLERRSEA
jgi:GTP-binding protein